MRARGRRSWSEGALALTLAVALYGSIGCAERVEEVRFERIVLRAGDASLEIGDLGESRFGLEGRSEARNLSFGVGTRHFPNGEGIASATVAPTATPREYHGNLAPSLGVWGLGTGVGGGMKWAMGRIEGDTVLFAENGPGRFSWSDEDGWLVLQWEEEPRGFLVLSSSPIPREVLSWRFRHWCRPRRTNVAGWPPASHGGGHDPSSGAGPAGDAAGEKR